MHIGTYTNIHVPIYVYRLQLPSQKSTRKGGKDQVFKISGEIKVLSSIVLALLKMFLPSSCSRFWMALDIKNSFTFIICIEKVIVSS